MKNKTKKYMCIITAIIISVLTIFMRTDSVAAANRMIYGCGNEMGQRSIVAGSHETSTFKASANRFRKGTWYAYSNGGFYLKVHKISGKKMTFSFHMPNMNIKKKTATIGANKKTATARIRCSRGKIHTLKIAVSGRSIKVKESSTCTKKILGYGVSERKKVIIHMFRPDGWVWY